MCSSLVETIDPLFLSNWTCCVQLHPTFSHDKAALFHLVPLILHLFSEQHETTIECLNVNLMPKILTLINICKINLNVSYHFSRLLFKWTWSNIHWKHFCLEPQNASSLHPWHLDLHHQNVCRSQMPYLYHKNTQAQIDTCDVDEIQPSLVDLRISLRD